MELKQGTIYKYIYTKMYLISECIESNTKKIHGYLSIADDKIDYYTWNNTCGASSSVILATEEEKQWYLACKKANKFIPQEEALKSFKQETKFIEGKWYKINNCWWAKFQTIHGSGVYWRYSEAIPQSKIYIDLPHNVLDWKDVSIELLTDLSEIQAYLPEGHVDKIKKEEPVDLLAEARKRFPVGSKFKCPNGNKSHYEANYNKEDDTWTVTTYKIIRIEGQDCVHSGNGYLHFKGKWAIIISEAKQPEEEKWKVGGWVRITKDFEYRGISYKKGEVYKITYVNKTINPSVISVDAADKKVEMYTEFSSQISECEWVGMNKPNELSMSNAHNWGEMGTRNNLAYLGTKGDEKPVEKEQLYNVTIKKSKVQQVEVVPLQKPCIISTRKSKFKLQIN